MQIARSSGTPHCRPDRVAWQCITDTVSLTNTIFAGNTVEDDAWDLVYDPTDPGVTIAYSLVQAPEDSSIEADLLAGTGNLVGLDPLLGPLAANGGLTLTHLPAGNSPVVGAGDPAFTGFTSDQRGESRVVGVIDIGAVEVQPTAPAGLPATGLDAMTPLMAGGAAFLAGFVLLAFRRRARA